MPQTAIPYDQIEVGHTITTPTVTVTDAMIDAYAELSGDRYEIHLDDAAARKRGFERRVAHGLLGLALTDGIKNQSEATYDAVASLGWDWSFKAPIYANDILHAQSTVTEKRRSKSTGRGIVRSQIELKNQDGIVVQSGTNTLMVV